LISSGKLLDMGQFRGVELDTVELTGARLRLRPWRAGDAARIVEALAEPSMHEFMALPRPYREPDAHNFITGMAGRAREQGVALECAVVELATDRVVGSAALRLHEEEVGYWIAPDAQGNGYAAEATTMLTEWAFGIGLDRVRLACDVRNLASARTALRAGFRFEGVGRNAVTSPGGPSVPPRRGDLARFARLPDDPAAPIPPAFAPLPSGGLSDGVLQLRVPVPGDATAIAETDDELTLQWGFTGSAHRFAEVERDVRQAALQWLVGTAAPFTMVDLATGRVAGSLRLRKAGPPQVGGIGYVVHPAFRGRGYTTRALRLLVPWAFEVADFARLELGAKEGNVASLRAAANAGFEPDGVRERRLRNPDGTFADELRYVLINPTYR
jgi:RimJ/RimL family protein N-acetyltransferase